MKALFACPRHPDASAEVQRADPPPSTLHYGALAVEPVSSKNPVAITMQAAATIGPAPVRRPEMTTVAGSEHATPTGGAWSTSYDGSCRVFDWSAEIHWWTPLCTGCNVLVEPDHKLTSISDLSAAALMATARCEIQLGESLFQFDWRSSITTIVVLVPALYAARWIFRLVKRKVGGIGWLGIRAVASIGGEAYVQRAAFRRYCRIELAKESTKYLPVPGSRDVALKTDEVYIPLTLESSDGGTLTTVNNIWSSDVKRVRIVGDPGSGKSSLVKQVFRQACRLALADPTRQIPVIINLKDFVPPAELYSDDVRAEWALRRIRKVIGADGTSDLGRLFDSAVDGRGVLLLLDGLDEVASESFLLVTDVVNALSRLLEHHSARNRIMLTMRTQFHQQVRRFFLSSFPPTFYIQSFTPGEIYSFLRKWPFPPAERDQNVERLYSELTDKPTLREMCRNPLILAMYVARDQQGQRTGAADNRTGFYKQVTEELLIARRSRQLGTAAKSALLQQREIIMGRLALENLMDPEQPANQISFKRAVAVTREVSKLPAYEIEDHLRNICKDTGLLTEERDGETLTFIHLTFCEFLAAKEAVEQDCVDDLLTAQKKFSSMAQSFRVGSRLIEVVPFALGLLPRARRPEVLTKAEKIADAAMLGRCFLESQLYEHPSWRNYVDHESQRLISTHSNDWDDSWLRRLHLFSVVLADEAEWAALQSRKATLPLDTLFKKLIRKDRERLATIFDSYAAFDSQSAFRLAYACGVDLVRERPDVIIRHMPDPPFLATLIEQCRKDNDGDPHPWVLLFSEGALSSSYVALRLSQESRNLLPFSAQNPIPNPADVPRRKRWYIPVSPDYSNLNGGMLKESLLTYGITCALATIDRYSYLTLPRLDIMRKAQAPGNLSLFYLMRYGRKARIIAAAIFVIAASLGAVIETRDLSLVLIFFGAASVIAMNAVLYPALASRYYTGIFLHSETVVSGGRFNLLTLPAKFLAHLAVGRKTFSLERITILRALRLAPGKSWQGDEIGASAQELVSTAKEVQGRTHRL